ncbi:MAG: M20/M25/M40 family metallo-hydrolase [Candidatus Krumholzibacteria bacterium]|nr:M20/M25/M40 family metallo-hydrolase [Candidatus Krumholzibacteria bacterium]
MKVRTVAITSAWAVIAAFSASLAVSGSGADLRPPQASSVERDSLESIVRFLTIDPWTAELKTRYALREAEMYETAEALAARLDQMAPGSVSLVPFGIVRHFEAGDSAFTSWNVVADFDLCGGCTDVFLVTAHYDATAARTEIWNDRWMTASAPGADDNGTGVAAALEIARALHTEELPFDLRVILFSGEELNRLGSIDYVANCDDACSGAILGVINLDMIGWSGEGFGATVMSDEYSGWLASLVEEVAGETHKDLPITVIRPGPWNWDHASFWEKTGIPVSAVTLSEPLGKEGKILYPYYHTIEDTEEKIDFAQTEAIAQLVLDLILRTNGSGPELCVYDTDIVYYLDGVEMPLKRFTADDLITVVVKVRNTGGAPGSGAAARLLIDHETASGSRRIFSGEIEVPGTLRTSDTSFDLDGAGLPAGGNMIRASVVATDPQDDPSNDSALSIFSVEAESGVLAGHNFRPNPVSGRFAEAMFCVNMEADADIHVEILNLEGESISTANLGYGYGVPLDPGYSCFRCGDIFPGVDRLASGVYLYRISLFLLDGTREEYRGRFAVAN